MRLAAALVFVMTAPVAAQDLPDPAGLLVQADAELRLTGAISACLTAVNDPSATKALFEAAGWISGEGYEGSTDYTRDDDYVMHWNDPGFCMVETMNMGTTGLSMVFGQMLGAAGWTAVKAPPGEDGCPVFDLGAGLRATITGGGQDPVCTAEYDAAVRIMPVGQ